MAKKVKLVEPAEEGGFAHHYGMVLGALVAVVAVVGLVILLSGEMTGNAVGASYDRNADSVCARECAPYSGQPIGHHGNSMGITYCFCKGPK